MYSNSHLGSLQEDVGPNRAVLDREQSILKCLDVLFPVAAKDVTGLPMLIGVSQTEEAISRRSTVSEVPCHIEDHCVGVHRPAQHRMGHFRERSHVLRYSACSHDWNDTTAICCNCIIDVEHAPFGFPSEQDIESRVSELRLLNGMEGPKTPVGL